jgi:radical SAM protein with 4Fe4S-binding SPASM domain
MESIKMAITNYTQYSHWLPNWLFKLMAKFYIDYKYPMHIYIETTTRCNLTCPHCPRPKIEEDMSWITFAKIIAECQAYGPRSFSLHGFGEPTMDKDLAVRMKFIKQLNPRNNVILTTNGVVINNEAYDLADKIIITYREPFNLDKYKPWKPKIMIRNFTDVPVPGTWICETKQYHNFGGNVPQYGTTVPKDRTRYPCYHLWLSPMIAWNGDILLCCNSPLHKGDSVLGNIGSNSIAEMWNSEKLKQKREEQKNGEYNGICRNCNVWLTYPRLF